MKVVLFAALRETAGTSRLDADAPTVGALLEDLSARFGPEFDRVMQIGTVVVNGETAGRDLELRPDDEVALLPPVSGGGGRRQLSSDRRAPYVGRPMIRTAPS